MRIFVALFIILLASVAHAADSCEAGYFLNDSGECEICPVGYYCIGGTAPAYPCEEGWTSGQGADDCHIIKPGYTFTCFNKGAYMLSDCHSPDYSSGAVYCPGGDINEYDAKCNSWASINNMQYRCPDNTYILSTKTATSIDDCIPCSPPPPLPDMCDISYGEDICEPFGGDGGVDIESCEYQGNGRVFTTDYGQAWIYGMFDANNNWGYTVVLADCPEGSAANTGKFFSSVPDALAKSCDGADGYILIDGNWLACSVIHPSFTHSDGARTQLTDCYGYIEPGYGFVMNNEDGTFSSQPCPAGDYCTGFVRITTELMTGETNMIGNTSCADVSAEHTLSDVGATGPEMCYTACDDSADITNGVLVSDGNAYYPNTCNYSIVCNSGYGLYDDTCVQMCASGLSYIKTNTGVSIPLFAQQRTNPSLHVLHNDMICYANAKIGNQPNTINFNYNGLEYHLEK